MIKKRNLDPSLVQWIMTQTGLGPGIGDIKFVVPAASSTSQYRTWLQEQGVSDGDMYTLPSLAYADVTADRNDVILVMPGSYTETAAISWAKDHTHMIGLGGPNTFGDHSLAGVTIYTSTTEVAEFLNITADRCIFMDFLIGNGGNHAGNLAAVNVDGWGNYFKRLTIQGIIADNQVTTEACCALSVDRLGHFPLFEDCVIGQNNWNVRTQANQGVLNFTATSAPQPQNGIFRRCTFLSRSETAAVAMVRFPVSGCIDRLWQFDNCVFDNFSQDWGNTLNQVFYEAASTMTNRILLKDCVCAGFTEWQTSNLGTMYVTNSPQAHAYGGVGVEATS